MGKGGGVGGAMMQGQRFEIIVILLALIIIAQAVLAVESREGQSGKWLILACIAVSGLPWMASQVVDKGFAHDQAKNDRIYRASGSDEGDQQQRGCAGEFSPAFERAARTANPGAFDGPNGRQPGRNVGSIDGAPTNHQQNAIVN